MTLLIGCIEGIIVEETSKYEIDCYSECDVDTFIIIMTWMRGKLGFFVSPFHYFLINKYNQSCVQSNVLSAGYFILT